MSSESQGSILTIHTIKSKGKLCTFNVKWHRIHIPIVKWRNRNTEMKIQANIRPETQQGKLRTLQLSLIPGAYNGIICTILSISSPSFQAYGLQSFPFLADIPSLLLFLCSRFSTHHSGSSFNTHSTDSCRSQWLSETLVQISLTLLTFYLP